MRRTQESQETRNDATRERILDAALEVFGKKGFAATTTKEIASKAKVNEVTLFRKFESKKALFMAVFGERFPLRNIREAVSIDPSRSVDDLLYHNVKGVLSALRSNKPMLMVFFSDAWRIPEMRKIYSEAIMKQGFEMASNIFGAMMNVGLIRKMDPMVAGRALIGMVQAYFLMNDIIGGGNMSQEDEEKLIRGFVSVFLDGMRVKEGVEK